jgi:hypothetical protein
MVSSGLSRSLAPILGSLGKKDNAAYGSDQEQCRANNDCRDEEYHAINSA